MIIKIGMWMNFKLRKKDGVFLEKKTKKDIIMTEQDEKKIQKE